MRPLLAVGARKVVKHWKKEPRGLVKNPAVRATLKKAFSQSTKSYPPPKR
jgi:hypothetical protein